MFNFENTLNNILFGGDNNHTNLIKDLHDNNLDSLSVLVGSNISSFNFVYTNMLDFLYYYCLSLIKIYEYSTCYKLLENIINNYDLTKSECKNIFHCRDICILCISDNHIQYTLLPDLKCKNGTHTLVLFHYESVSVNSLHETLNSFLNCCDDANTKIIKVYVLSISSYSTETQNCTTIVHKLNYNMLKLEYPFIEIVCIFNKNDCYDFIKHNIDSEYIILLESGWNFVTPKPYLTYINNIFNTHTDCGICIFNRSFIQSATIEDSNIHYVSDIEENPPSSHMYNFVYKNGVKTYYTDTNTMYNTSYVRHPCVIKSNIIKSIKYKINDIDFINEYYKKNYLFYLLTDINVLNKLIPQSLIKKI
jgi:predicted small secreted protein